MNQSMNWSSIQGWLKSEFQKGNFEKGILKSKFKKVSFEKWFSKSEYSKVKVNFEN